MLFKESVLSFVKEIRVSSPIEPGVSLLLSTFNDFKTFKFDILGSSIVILFLDKSSVVNLEILLIICCVCVCSFLIDYPLEKETVTKKMDNI